jgi:tRNA threonylcarbamoyladenosine dehydratase
MSVKDFSYSNLVKRNLGIFTTEEQQILKNSVVAIAGCGGAGGEAAVTLARMGVGNIRLADPDTFDESNCNRQFGASTKTIGINKAEVIAQYIKDINPECNVTYYIEGATEKNVEEFLSGSNLALEEIDFLQPYFTALFHRTARGFNIPIMTSVPVAWGAFLFFFLPEGLSYEEYVGKERDCDLKDFENFSNPPTAYAPELPMYLGDSLFEDIANGKTDIPVVGPGVNLSAGTLASFVALYLTEKKKIEPVPHYYSVDDLFLLESKLNVYYNAKFGE